MGGLREVHEAKCQRRAFVFRCQVVWSAFGSAQGGQRDDHREHPDTPPVRGSSERHAVLERLPARGLQESGLRPTAPDYGRRGLRGGAHSVGVLDSVLLGGSLTASSLPTGRCGLPARFCISLPSLPTRCLLVCSGRAASEHAGPTGACHCRRGVAALHDGLGSDAMRFPELRPLPVARVPRQCGSTSQRMRGFC